jgi:hypothetical protein
MWSPCAGRRLDSRFRIPHASYTPNAGTIDSATITLIWPELRPDGVRAHSRQGERLGRFPLGVPTCHKFEVTITGGLRLEPEVIGVCPQCEVVAEVRIRYGT